MKTTDEGYKKWKSYNKTIFPFNGDFVLMNHPPQEDGLYITIHCGRNGIYQTLNWWENGKFGMENLDGSDTIAYSKEKVEKFW